VVVNLPQRWKEWLVFSSLCKWMAYYIQLGRMTKENLFACGFYQVTDLTLAKENQTSFEEYLSNNPNADPGIDLTVTVLTTGFWPSYKSFDLNLPAEMVFGFIDGNCSEFIVQLFGTTRLVHFCLQVTPLLYFRLDALKFSRNFIKQKLSTESLHGFIPWEPAT